MKQINKLIRQLFLLFSNKCIYCEQDLYEEINPFNGFVWRLYCNTPECKNYKKNL